MLSVCDIVSTCAGIMWEVEDSGAFDNDELLGKVSLRREN